MFLFAVLNNLPLAAIDRLWGAVGDAKNGYGCTTNMFAARYANYDIVDYLAKRKVDLSIIDSYGNNIYDLVNLNPN